MPLSSYKIWSRKILWPTNSFWIYLDGKTVDIKFCFNASVLQIVLVVISQYLQKIRIITSVAEKNILSLKILKIESLHDRRERLGLRFAQKCLKHEKFSDMFPKSQSTFRSRNKEKYHVNMANRERYKHSSIPFLQRKLNENSQMEKNQLRVLLRVNCVSNVDSIT